MGPRESSKDQTGPHQGSSTPTRGGVSGRTLLRFDFTAYACCDTEPLAGKEGPMPRTLSLCDPEVNLLRESRGPHWWGAQGGLKRDCVDGESGEVLFGADCTESAGLEIESEVRS